MTTPDCKTELRSGGRGHAVHDVGGLAFGPIDQEEHDLALWEKRVDAMLILLASVGKAAFKIDAMRRVIEDYGEQQYDATTYYQKWIRAIRNLIIEQEIVTTGDLAGKLAEVRAEIERSGRKVVRDEVPLP